MYHGGAWNSEPSKSSEYPGGGILGGCHGVAEEENERRGREGKREGKGEEKGEEKGGKKSYENRRRKKE